MGVAFDSVASVHVSIGNHDDRIHFALVGNTKTCPDAIMIFKSDEHGF